MTTRHDLDQYFAKVRELKENEEYSDALVGYLDILDNHRTPRVFRPADLIEAISELMEMGKSYPAAVESLLHLKSRWEEKILSGVGDREAMHDVHIINVLMERPDENLRFLQQLSILGPKRRETYEAFLDLTWKDIAGAGRYAELESCIDEQTWNFLCQMARYHVNWDFAADAEKRDEWVEMLEHLIPDAILIYEVLLSLGKDGSAAKLTTWIFDCEPLAEAPDLFIAAANKLGRRDVAEALAQARKSVPIA